MWGPIANSPARQDDHLGVIAGAFAKSVTALASRSPSGFRTKGLRRNFRIKNLPKTWAEDGAAQESAYSQGDLVQDQTQIALEQIREACARACRAVWS